MIRKTLLTALSSIGIAIVAVPAFAADITPERLQNARGEPQNWLMVHRDYDNSRHSPLSEINRGNIKDLKLKFMVSIGGRATGGTLRGKEEGTPLVEDGFMYVADTWSRVMKFDVRSGTEAVPLWRYDPKITRSRTVRGIAMYGNKVFLTTYDARVIALDKENGQVVWEVNGAAALDMCFKEDPVAYCKLVAGTVPRDYRIETTKITELADDELDRMISTLRERALAVRQDRALELEKAPEQKLLNGRQH
jgi:glucose dehydrogenase